jgi:hypothetical protein
MSSCVKNDETGQQLFLDRENWFSGEALSLIEAAVAQNGIGPRRTLAMILHDGLGFPLSLVALLQGTTKNVVAKNVISGKRRMKKLAKKLKVESRQLSLFDSITAESRREDDPDYEDPAAAFLESFSRAWESDAQARELSV